MKKFSLLRKGARWIGALMVLGAMMVVSGSAWAGGNGNGNGNTGLNLPNPTDVKLAYGANLTFNVVIGSNTPLTIGQSNITSWSNGVTQPFTLNFGFNSNTSFNVIDNSNNVYTILGIRGVYLSPTTNLSNPENIIYNDPYPTNTLTDTLWDTGTTNQGEYIGSDTSLNNGFDSKTDWLSYTGNDYQVSGSQAGSQPLWGAFSFNVNNSSPVSENENEFVSIDAQYYENYNTNSLYTGGFTLTGWDSPTPVVPESPGALLLLGGAAPLLGALVLFRRRLFSA